MMRASTSNFNIHVRGLSQWDEQELWKSAKAPRADRLIHYIYVCLTRKRCRHALEMELFVYSGVA